jgi:nitroimidazol reductase NimA-like FMN-containing flavoprotein (pyridoxamine 5'-phosphate oxidase superfamily)
VDPQEITEELDHPGARNLLASATLLRLAYNGSDGFPRVIPIGFYWNGNQIVESQVRSMYAQMARISIEPVWARFFDFGAGRMPSFLTKLAGDV